MWVVLDAEPGASLILGLREGVSAKDFQNAIQSGKLSDVMREVPVKAGDVFYIPAGLLHAIGAGILIAEIQQNSDTTYRVYDYERRGADGKLRQLHVKEALDVVRPISDDEIRAAQFSVPMTLPGKALAATPFFSVSETTGDVTFLAPRDTFLSLLVTSGEGTLTAQGETLRLKAADSVLLPSDIGSVEIKGDLTCLIARP
jgi:mannose-6-phosphate isomerase